MCIGEGNSTDPLTPVSTNMRHNLGKLQFIVLENYICSCVVGFLLLPKKYFFQFPDDFLILWSAIKPPLACHTFQFLLWPRAERKNQGNNQQLA